MTVVELQAEIQRIFPAECWTEYALLLDKKKTPAPTDFTLAFISSQQISRIEEGRRDERAWLVALHEAGGVAALLADLREDSSHLP